VYLAVCSGIRRLAAEEYVRALRAGEKLAVAMMDIDRFKYVNDRYGHAVGDLVLVKVADGLSDQIHHARIMGLLTAA
jgi:diguanylate cyclase (GGDEF)-like protein